MENGEQRKKELESVSPYLKMYNEFQKAKSLGILFNAHDFTKNEIDAFYIIDNKIKVLRDR